MLNAGGRFKEIKLLFISNLGLERKLRHINTEQHCSISSLVVRSSKMMKKIRSTFVYPMSAFTTRPTLTQLTRPHMSVKTYIDQSNMIKTYDKQMHVANCECLLRLTLVWNESRSVFVCPGFKLEAER